VKIFVFAGPTLGADEARSHLDAVYLPPAAQGDVYQVTREHPWAIGLVDGYFDRVPAVWHKEILWALSRGIHVFGAASMGALRAAELAAFGMEGIGAIFEAFRSGELEDDDEVAVAHGSAALGYPSVSEALVNIRFTLAAAVREQAVSGDVAAALIRIGKDLFYPERSLAAILARAAGQGLPADELSSLAAWLPGRRVDQKRADAVAMLQRIRERMAADPSPKQVRFHFQHTEPWEELRRQVALRRPLSWAGDVSREDLLDELRLDDERYRRERDKVLIRLLALELARQVGMSVDENGVYLAAEQLRRAHGLFDPAGLREWIERQGLTAGGFERLARDEALLSRILESLAADLEGSFHDHLRASGAYGALASRAREKEESLSSRGLANPSLAETGMSEEDLWRWYFEERRGRPVPADLDAHARSLDLSGVSALRRLALREREFFLHPPPLPR
jgi:hypothetical protein